MKKIVIGLSQNEFAAKAGIGWHQVSRLVIRGVITPVAEKGNQLIFDPDDVPKAAAAVKQLASDDVAKWRPEWEKLSAKDQAQYGDFRAFISFKKNESRFQSFQNGRSCRVRVGGAE